MISLHCLRSSSSGNCFLYTFDDIKIIVDVGITKTELKKKLEKLGHQIKDIDYIFITHQHSDHYNQAVLEMFDEKKVYTYKVGDWPQRLYPLKILECGRLKVVALELSHDVPCVGFLFQFQDKKLVHLTDTGYIKTKYFPILENPDLLVIESNYCFELEINSNRSKYLIDRVVSVRGHLSNEDSADAINSIVREKNQAVLLVHLSLECNSPEIALNTAKSKNPDINFLVAKPFEIVEFILK